MVRPPPSRVRRAAARRPPAGVSGRPSAAGGCCNPRSRPRPRPGPAPWWSHGLGDGKPLAGLPEGPGGVLGCPARALGQQVAGTATDSTRSARSATAGLSSAGTRPAAIARQRRTDVASAALASPSLAASVHNCAAGSAASVARSAATGSSIRVAVTAAIAPHVPRVEPAPGPLPDGLPARIAAVQPR